MDELYSKIKKRLEVGMEFKNSAQLFKELDFDKSYLNGAKKIRTLAKLNCCMEWENINGGHYLRITKIYSPKERKEYICPTDNGYKKKIELKTKSNNPFDIKLSSMKLSSRYKYLYPNIALLSDYAARNEIKKYNFCISNSNLLYELGFVNHKYIDLSNFLNEEMNLKSNKELRPLKEKYTFKSIINSVSLKSIIIGKDKFKIFRENGFFEFYEEYLIKDNSDLIRFADNEIKEYIITRQQEIGRDTSVFVIKRHREELNNLLYKNFNLKLIGKTNHFIFNRDYKPAVLSNDERTKLRKMNNQNSLSRIKKRINYNLPKVYDNYQMYRNGKTIDYVYPYDCGDLDSCFRTMNDLIKEYILI